MLGARRRAGNCRGHGEDAHVVCAQVAQVHMDSIRRRVRASAALCVSLGNSSKVGKVYIDRAIEAIRCFVQKATLRGPQTLSFRMNASISPRSSASEPLSPQTAAASLSWSPLPNVRDDEADVAEGSEAEGEGDLTPALVRVSLVAGLGGA